MGFVREAGPHRVPGICISLVGFLLLFAGIMMIAMGTTIASRNSKALRVGGICATLFGVSCVIAGFVYQYLVHKDWKQRRLAKLARRKALQNDIIISGRAKDYLAGPSTSGSMVELGITEDDQDYNQAANYFHQNELETNDQIGKDNPALELDEDPVDDAEYYRPKNYQLFTVSNLEDVSMKCDDFRSSSPGIVVCHNVIDDMASENDESDTDDMAQSKDSTCRLNVSQSLDTSYSPRLTKRQLEDLNAEIDDDIRKSLSDLDQAINEHSSSNTDLNIQHMDTKDLTGNHLDEIKPVANQNLIKSTNCDDKTVYGHDNHDDIEKDLPLMKRKRRKKVLSENTESKRHKELSPKGKATKGTAIKSSRFIKKRNKLDMKNSNEKGQTDSDDNSNFVSQPLEDSNNEPQPNDLRNTVPKSQELNDPLFMSKQENETPSEFNARIICDLNSAATIEDKNVRDKNMTNLSKEKANDLSSAIPPVQNGHVVSTRGNFSDWDSSDESEITSSEKGRENEPRAIRADENFGSRCS